MDEMKFFFEQSRVEQEYRLNDVVPTLEEYWACRMGTSAVAPCVAMAEYVGIIPSTFPTDLCVFRFPPANRHCFEGRFCNHIKLPSGITKDLDMKTIWDETNIGISMLVSPSSQSL